MFWKRRKEASSKVPKQALIVEAYLAGALPLISDHLEAASARAGAQVFILGIADMVRQSEGLSWEEFVEIYSAALDSSGLLPSIPTAEFIEAIGDAANTEPAVTRLVQKGAQSIQMYVGERDGMAPVDLSLAVKFAQSNEEALLSIRGAV